MPSCEETLMIQANGLLGMDDASTDAAIWPIRGRSSRTRMSGTAVFTE